MSFTLLGGKLTLKTPRSYPRPPEDALWLAASFTPKPNATVLDAACGIGTVSLALLTREPSLHITALDINPTLTLCVSQNAVLNHYKITTISENILNHSLNTKYEAIFCNPPFHEAAKGHATPSPTQAERHQMPENLLKDWLTHFSKLLAPTGTIALILHTHQQTELTALAKTLSLGGNLYPLQTAADKKPKRLIAHLTSTQKHITLCDTIPAYDPELRQKILELGEALTLPDPRR